MERRDVISSQKIQEHPLLLVTRGLTPGPEQWMSPGTARLYTQLPAQCLTYRSQRTSKSECPNRTGHALHTRRQNRPPEPLAHAPTVTCITLCPGQQVRALLPGPAAPKPLYSLFLTKAVPSLIHSSLSGEQARSQLPPRMQRCYCIFSSPGTRGPGTTGKSCILNSSSRLFSRTHRLCQFPRSGSRSEGL